MIDTHIHFNSKALSSVWREALSRAENAGVKACIVVGYDLASSERAVALAETDTRLYATVGIHPHDAEHWNADSEKKLSTYLEHPRVVALGEIGLDFYRDLSPRDAQYAAFSAQLTLAKEKNLPVVIHCRDAYDEALEVLEAEAGGLNVVLHCFGGNLEQAKRAWSHGWYIGVDGPVTFKKNEALREIIAACPPELLVLETDCPWLAPEPFRGKFPNEPAWLPHVAEAVARTRGTSVTELDALTTANAQRLFPKLSL
ncbi:MAG: TatD family hydrolase [Armatimonas sp.]